MPPAPSSPCAAPAPVIEYVAPAFVSDGFGNLQFSSKAVEASASQVVGSFLAVDKSASPVYIHFHQEQVVADPECVERVQQRTVHVPILQIQEQFVESAKEIPQERLSERIEEQIEDVPIPESVCCVAPTRVIEDVTPEPGVPPPSAIEHVAPAPVIG